MKNPYFFLVDIINVDMKAVLISQTAAIDPSPNAHRSCFPSPGPNNFKWRMSNILNNADNIDTPIPVVQDLGYWDDRCVVNLLLSVY